ALLLIISFSSCKTPEKLIVTPEETNDGTPEETNDEMPTPPVFDDERFKIVAYLPKYTPTLADHIDAFDFSKVTHINIAFFNPDANGNFHASQGTGLDQIVAKAHQHNVRVLLSIGGGSLRPNYTELLK